jgi:hypothetical protein
MEAGNCLFTCATVSFKKEITPRSLITFSTIPLVDVLAILTSKDPAMLFAAIIGFGNNSVATFYLSNYNSVRDKSDVEPE